MNSDPSSSPSGETPPSPDPLAGLNPPTGGGAKPWVIMAVLVTLIGGGLFFLINAGDDEEAQAGKKKVEEKAKIPTKTKAREAVKTESRPLKKEMPVLSVKNRDKFGENVGKWVMIEGEVSEGNEEGEMIFKSPAGLKGQLVRGSAEHQTGKVIKVIGWLINEDLIQVDGIQDVETIDPLDLLPKKDVYTMADGEQLVALRGTKATFEGKVEKVRISGDKKKIYLVFESNEREFFGSGEINKIKKDGLTEDSLKGLIGKTIKLTGKLEYKSWEKKNRVSIVFTKKDHYEIVE